MISSVAKRLTAALAVVALLAVAVLGCGGDGNEGVTQEPSTQTPEPSPTVDVQPPPTATTPPITPTPQPPAPETRQFYEDFLDQEGRMLERAPEEADVTGDGYPEVLLHAHTRDCAGCAVKTFYVMSGPDAVFEFIGEGWVAALPDAGGFEWYSAVSIPGEGACCPSWFAVETYRWTGAAFEPQVPIRLEHFLEVNQYPITGPLEPSVQVATVALYYGLDLTNHHDEAYALLSSQYQAANSFDAWRAGFPQDAALFPQVIEAGAEVTEVHVLLLENDYALGRAGDKGTYEGTWTLVEENGVWKMDASMLEFTPR